MNYLPEPITRVERYLARIAGNTDVSIPEKPITRKEHYLAAWAEKSTFYDVTVTGNPAVLDNATGKPFKDLHIYGRSEQVTTTGAQLLDLGALELRQETGATINRLDDGGFLINGTPKTAYEQYTRVFTLDLEPGTYYISGGKYSAGCAVVQINITNADDTKSYRTNRRFDVLGTEKEISIVLQSTSTDPIDNYKVYPMLNKGSAALPFEPYTGGKPSPSPDYPQEIVNAGKDGNLNVTVRGKNLLELTDTKVQNNNLKFEINKGSITFSGTADGASFIHKIKDFVVPRDGIYTISTNSDDSINESPRILISVNGAALENAFAGVTKELSTGSVISLYIRVSAAGSYNGRMIKPMIEKNSEGTVYEPYHEPQSMSVTTPNGLPGIPVTSGGNYTDETGQQWICDEVDFGRGVYVQRIEYKEYSDASKWKYRLTASNKNNNFQTNIFGVDIGTDKNYPTQCNLLPYKNQGWDDNAINLLKIYVYNREITASFPPNSDINSIDKWDELLKKKPLKIQYVLDTPIETPLTASEIAAYKSLRTYKGTTIVEAEDKAGISVTYTKFKERSI